MTVKEEEYRELDCILAHRYHVESDLPITLGVFPIGCCKGLCFSIIYVQKRLVWNAIVALSVHHFCFDGELL